MTDDELMATVRATFQAYEPVPVPVLAAASAAFRWRDAEASLARLTDDSRRLPAGLRGGASRLLTFSGTDLSVEIEVTGAGRAREIAGQLLPPVPAQVWARHPDGELTTRADAVGQFVVSDVPPGLVSLLFQLPDATSIVTSWIRL